jgi:hypothetical protein
MLFMIYNLNVPRFPSVMLMVHHRATKPNSCCVVHDVRFRCIAYRLQFHGPIERISQQAHSLASKRLHRTQQLQDP